MMAPDCGCTIVQKTHLFTWERDNADNQFKGNILLIIRNPYKALISLRNHEVTNQTGHAPNSSFIGPGTVFYKTSFHSKCLF